MLFGDCVVRQNSVLQMCETIPMPHLENFSHWQRPYQKRTKRGWVPASPKPPSLLSAVLCSSSLRVFRRVLGCRRCRCRCHCRCRHRLCGLCFPVAAFLAAIGRIVIIIIILVLLQVLPLDVSGLALGNHVHDVLAAVVRVGVPDHAGLRLDEFQKSLLLGLGLVHPPEKERLLLPGDLGSRLLDRQRGFGQAGHGQKGIVGAAAAATARRCC
mmetsp:Transcript_30326/g.71496  ORF Transcript_30326/g.71496 Transcript_30326/m.71496 type:complete len:213 (+) Transcript_30326:66-704(+)